MITLPQNKITVLKAQDPKYKRGLLVKYNKDGSYDMEYWFDKPSDVYPVEVTVDGKSVKKDARKVSMLYHPELGSPRDLDINKVLPGPEFGILDLDTPFVRGMIITLGIARLIYCYQCKKGKR